jgi:hypothetical protein
MRLVSQPPLPPATFSADELLALFERAIEGRAELAVAAKLELLTEYAELARRLAGWSRRQGLAEPAAELDERAREAGEQAWRPASAARRRSWRGSDRASWVRTAAVSGLAQGGPVQG